MVIQRPAEHNGLPPVAMCLASPGFPLPTSSGYGCWIPTICFFRQFWMGFTQWLFCLFYAHTVSFEQQKTGYM
jgi:hypothetical protein